MSSSVPPSYPPRPPVIPGVPPAYPIPINANLDSAGNVTSDTPCRKCSYNLRGLNINGRCPECGAAVGLSVHGDLLRFSDPKWVRMLERGVRFIIIGIAIMIIGGILGVILMMVVPIVAYLLPVIFVGAYLVMLVGTWQLTERDPSGLGEDKYGTSRKIIRIALVVGLINTALSNIPRAGSISPDVRMILTVIGGIAGLIGLVGQFALLNYLSKLALRIPDMTLSERARFLMWAIGISYGIVVIGGVIMVIAGSSGAGAGLMGGGCIMVLAFLALVVFGIMYLLMLDKIRKAFDEQARVAEQTWAAGSAATA